MRLVGYFEHPLDFKKWSALDRRLFCLATNMWLMETLRNSMFTLYGRPACAFTQAEASRALASLLSDPNTSESVLGRPHALPYLLHFAASLHVNDAVEVCAQS
jgi:hypothetical protein